MVGMLPMKFQLQKENNRDGIHDNWGWGGGGGVGK